MNRLTLIALVMMAWFSGAIAADSGSALEVKGLSLNGGWQDGKGRLVIEADLRGFDDERDRLFYAAHVEHQMRVSREKIIHHLLARMDVISGRSREIIIGLAGQGEVLRVKSDALQDWSVRQDAAGARFLVLRLKKSELTNQIAAVIEAETEIKDPLQTTKPLALAPVPASFFNGHLKVEFPGELDVQAESPSGLAPIEAKYLPEGMRAATEGAAEPLAFRFGGAGYLLPLKVGVADPEARQIVLRDFSLTGQVGDDSAAFALAATARVRNPKGGSLDLLSGGVALTEIESHPDWRLKFEQGRFVLVTDRPGDFPVRLKFNAAVQQGDGWSAVDFRVAPSTLQPVVLQGLAADTQFKFADAARPERDGADFKTFLPAGGQVKLAWKQARKEVEGKLFYAAEMLAQVAVSPGLMRQTALLEGKVMQGEMGALALRLLGQGEITRVQGDPVLSWKVEKTANPDERRLIVQFNQPQKDRFLLVVQMQTPLGVFPQAMDTMLLRPEGATRWSGYYRVVNEGAVRLEVLQSAGLSQISPEHFPESDATKALLREGGGQRFAFRFSGIEHSLRVQADNVLPEVSVSELLTYHLGETELSLEAELELDIREAPLREVTLRVPKGFAVARLTAQGMNDYFLKDEPEGGEAQLRLVYGAPLIGRQVVHLRLERNKPLGEAAWILPRLELLKAKSVRGHLAVSADAGYRLSPEKTQSLTDIATAFFPKKLAGIQSAFRLSDAAWQAVMKIERLPQSVQADVFHLFSIGEGVAYGSSTMNFLVSGAPLSVFKVELSPEYFNVEFTGKDIRNWQKTAEGYVVQLHTPVAGAYTLLATYERPFKAQGDTLTFVGARPLDAQSEQGHTIVISAYQFQVKPVTVSPGLLALETAEVPAEYRLFFDSPVLSAYRYTARPFDLKLALSPLAQGETLSLVVDRALLATRISKEGQIITDARYFVKNRGNPHFRLSLPEGVELWAATVNGVTAVPVKDAKGSLIPLPQRGSPDAVQQLDLKLAARSSDPAKIRVAAPIIGAPLLLAEWKLHPDEGRRLVYHRGSLTPAQGIPDVSGFAGLARLLAEGQVWLTILAALGLAGICVWSWRWASREGVYKFSARYWVGAILGLISFLLTLVVLVAWGDMAEHQNRFLPNSLAFLAPVQQSGSALVLDVLNLPAEASMLSLAWTAYPVALALIVWFYTWLNSGAWWQPLGRAAGWTMLAWAALRWPNGAAGVAILLGVFLLVQVVIPAARRLWNSPRKPKPPVPSPSPAAAAMLAGLLLVAASALGAAPATKPPSALSKEPPLAESVRQKIRVAENQVFASAAIRWQAQRHQLLPLLYEPGVLTRIAYSTNALKLVHTSVSGKNCQALLALEEGAFDIDLDYQMITEKRDGNAGFTLPTQYGLVNRLAMCLADLDVDIAAPQAVAAWREAGSVSNATLATVILPPLNNLWIGWKPRSRDLRREKAVFYAEICQLFVPTAGVIEGEHQAVIRPAQGELSELVFEVPAGATITDVLDPTAVARAGAPGKPAPPGKSIVSLWRFDPDARKLRVSLSPAQSRPFTVIVKSQVATGPLPYQQQVGLISVTNAADQIGLVGVATGQEVQLENVTAETFSTINLEDFPAAAMQSLRAQVAGLTLRRSFRYAGARGELAIKAAPVEPDVRVEMQQTLSLGEDRTVLAGKAEVEINRAGIFRLSFALPEGLEVESLSGPALSHWTELKSGAARIITMHLRGKTEGRQQFAITLAGQGLRARQGWAVPQLNLREATKQQGQLVLVPEQGMRLQVEAREGVTQLDPLKAGIRQKGVLAFRLLQSAWNLTLNVEQVDPWIQVTSLQHVTLTEAQARTVANLQYQIENTGLKSLRVRLPEKADSVRFKGEQVADFLPVSGQAADGLQEWEIKLHRRMIGKYLLQASYQTLLPPQAKETEVRGVQALGVNLQRGFLTLQAEGRLQARADALPAALQPTEWQGIPRALRQDLPSVAANYAFRLVEPAYVLPLKIERHEAERLLPARVNSVTLTSVISDDAGMLTQARLEMLPGDKRLLHLTLPAGAQFWFAFVNQNGVWPWREKDRILIPLEMQPQAGGAVVVEFFYSSQAGAATPDRLNLELLGPKFDLPLENITWNVYVGEKWQPGKWTGSLQLRELRPADQPAAVDLNAYLEGEAVRQREKTKEAEQMLARGNALLEQGDPRQARRAFQAAYGLSQHDAAFNEDARVQLHNLKLQQALVGLNARQAALAGDADADAARLRELGSRMGRGYTQREVKEMLDRSTPEENAARLRLAERLIQQQDAAVASAAAIRAAIPEQGRLLTFKRAVQVDTWADLKIGLQAAAAREASWGMRLLILAGLLMVFGLLGWLAGRAPSSSHDAGRQAN